jgi:hypothetical protein
MQYVIRGMLRSDDLVETASTALYENYCWEPADESLRIEMVAIGSVRDLENYPDLEKPPLQITFDQVARFVFGRFTKHCDPKKAHRQWDCAGHMLWHLAKKQWNDSDAFVAGTLKLFGIHPQPQY